MVENDSNLIQKNHDSKLCQDECPCSLCDMIKHTNWISVKDQEPDLDKIHFLVDGDSIFIRGTWMQPFLFQVCGEIKPICDVEWTHWMPLPDPPN